MMVPMITVLFVRFFLLRDHHIFQNHQTTLIDHQHKSSCYPHLFFVCFNQYHHLIFVAIISIANHHFLPFCAINNHQPPTTISGPSRPGWSPQLRRSAHLQVVALDERFKHGTAGVRRLQRGAGEGDLGFTAGVSPGSGIRDPGAVHPSCEIWWRNWWNWWWLLNWWLWLVKAMMVKDDESRTIVRHGKCFK